MQILIQIIKKEKRHFSGGNVFLFFCIVSFRVMKKLIFTAFCE